MELTFVFRFLHLSHACGIRMRPSGGATNSARFLMASMTLLSTSSRTSSCTYTKLSLIGSMSIGG